MSNKDAKTTSKIPHAMPGAGSMMIPFGRLIVDDEFNVRQTKDDKTDKALAASMKVEGQLQDVVVEQVDDGNFKLLAGFRRVRAATLLGWDGISAKVWAPTDDKGELLTDRKEIEVARYFVNIAENVARDSITPFDLAFRCKELKTKYEMKGEQIAKRVAKNTSYVNNLLAVVGGVEKGEHAGNTLIPQILERWKEECSWSEDDLRQRICNVQRLRSWVTLDHKTQAIKFDEELYVASGGDREQFWKDRANTATNGGANTTPQNDHKAEGIKRPSQAHLEKALEAAKRVKKETPAKEKEKIARLNGVIDGLEFAIGVKTGMTNRITGVCAFKDGEMTEGMAPKKVEEKAAGAN